jgi:hypothetical protein
MTKAEPSTYPGGVADPEHNAAVPLWECPCRECTALDYGASEVGGLTLAEYRHQEFPEIYPAAGGVTADPLNAELLAARFYGVPE